MTTYRDLACDAAAAGRIQPALLAGAASWCKAAVENRRAPLVVNYRLNAGYLPPDHWVHGPQGGGRNVGEACHMYDVFQFLTGAPVQSVSATPIDPGTLPYFRNDNFVATIGYADGSVCTLTYTSLGPKTGLGKEYIEVFCDGEAYIVDDFKKLTKASDGSTLWSGETDKGHREELSRFGDAIAERRPVADSVRGSRRDLGAGAAHRGPAARASRGRRMRSLYLAPTGLLGVVDDPRLDATTERHKMDMTAQPYEPQGHPITALARDENLKGLVLEMYTGWPGRDRLTIAGSALDLGRRVWVYWPGESAVECVDARAAVFLLAALAGHHAVPRVSAAARQDPADHQQDPRPSDGDGRGVRDRGRRIVAFSRKRTATSSPRYGSGACSARRRQRSAASPRSSPANRPRPRRACRRRASVSRSWTR